MRKVLSFIGIAFISILISGCAFLFSSVGDVWVMNCEHGTLNVSVTYEDSTAKYTIIAEPEAGYELLEDNVFVYEHDNSSLGFSIGIKTRKSNEFYFSCEKKYDLIINARFTQVESE